MCFHLRAWWHSLRGWMFSGDGSVQPKCLHQSFLLLLSWGGIWRICCRQSSLLFLEEHNSEKPDTEDIRRFIITPSSCSISWREKNFSAIEINGKTWLPFRDGITPYTDTNACILKSIDSDNPKDHTKWLQVMKPSISNPEYSLMLNNVK